MTTGTFSALARSFIATGLVLALLGSGSLARAQDANVERGLAELEQRLLEQLAAKLAEEDALRKRNNPAAPVAQGKAAAAVQPAAEDALNLVFLGDKKPVLIRLNLLVEGKSVNGYWNEHFERWYRYIDVKNNGLFTDEDLKLAPSSIGVTNMMRQGIFIPGRGDHLSLTLLGKQAGDKVTLEEFQAYYRKMIPPVQILPQFNNDAIYAQAGNALFKALDTNKDGKLSKEEILAAAKTLRKLDLDDDEWITLAELTPNFANNQNQFQQRVMNQNGGGYSPQINEAFFQVRPGDDLIGQVLLDRYDREKVQRLTRQDLGLDKATFAKLDKNSDGSLDREELNSWHARAADIEFTIHVGQNNLVDIVKTQMPFLPFVTQNTSGTYQLGLEDAQIALATTSTSRQQQQVIFAPALVGQSQFLLQQFAQADKQNKGFLEIKDVAGQQYQVLRSVFDYLDRDKDGKLTRAEVETFVNLQSGIAIRSLTVGVAEHGRAFFQLLDSNRDGRLSQRELLDAWKVLEPLDKEKTGFINPTDLIRQFTISVQRGANNNVGGFVVVNPGFNPNQPPVMAPRLPEGTPDWFRKMDRNGDGDVSIAEFLGTRAEFERIDVNHDGLISPDEAIRYDAQKRQAK